MTTSTTRRLALLLTALAAIGLGACGDDDGVATGDAAPTADAGVGADEAAYGAECSPVGEDLVGQATDTIRMQLADYAFVPADLEVGAGIVTFDVANIGGEPHELAFLPGGGEVPLDAEGAPDEEALGEAGAFELEAFPAGQDCRATYDLAPGEYTLFCIAEAPDGETHYQKGMAGKLTVG